VRLVFAGTPAFAAPTLEALVAAGHSVVAVYTRPDRPAGRGRQVTPSPIKTLAAAYGLEVRQPDSLRDGAPALAALRPDTMVVVAYGLILPPPILALPRLGCINVHASLLPRWRGAAPIARALEAGDAETGVSIMQMEAGLDTGPVYAQVRTPIRDDDTTASLETRLAQLGAELLIDTLGQLERGHASARPQDAAAACYAPKLQTAEAVIDWREAAAVLHRRIRAFNPRPVARTTLRGETVRIWDVAALATTGTGAPGTIVRSGPDAIDVGTGSGILTLTRLQAPGGKPLAARDFLNGRRLVPGDRFGT